MPKRNINVFEEGDVLVDSVKKEWRLGKIIGQGGFGFIFLAYSQNNEEYVVKIEPKSNGPLFVEQVFYQRIGKRDMITLWSKNNHIDHLGIPVFYGFGFHKKNGIDYRFIIINRLGCDLNKIIQCNNNKLPERSVFLIASKIIMILKYLHENGYTHSDIKASNIAIDINNKNKIYLLDYGLSYRFMINGNHVEYKRDPKKMHNGTIEYTSIDMHKGVSPSRRGDLEILGYCIIKWLGGKLPWENDLKNCKYVMESKIKYMNDIGNLMTDSLGSNYPEKILKYFNYIKTLQYDSIPDYEKIMSFFLL
ncbi:hypothetical protein [Lumpy skin disease virus]|uniref:Putative Ser/Thr protein kinase n=1 Tax=Lumpy skin disease virus TaxID=59509 RepID=Q91MM5_LSDV|nr:LSDV139 putative ser/thr protein kinase [Lumpy skin disease virus NI-2490]AAN02707.1 putative Ser/Thr protein kinase [Lumpy skin disease virus NW-LW]AOE47714.1 putative Ser/Thr protein kinase [Lumpy skin disease virus]AAK85100.1 LSDV139 putative ser/thr protein kinase [Lumpy skin disease virus NI-2490]ARO77447.1 putative Ser/Thr protein kinase [Lumpy skin disease virus]ATG80326.1 putative Ser-Thr protein kinase [Lumpy skin disease virus]